MFDTKLDTDITEMFPSDISEVSRISVASEYDITTNYELQDLLLQPTCDSFVSRVQSGIVGYARCRRDEDSGIAIVDGLSVTPELRRCTIGSQLLKHIKSHLQPFMMIDTILVTVAETNLCGQVFLRHNGFVCTGIVPCHSWPDCDAAYVMHMPLR